jgi:hypothetical protein
VEVSVEDWVFWAIFVSDVSERASSFCGNEERKMECDMNSALWSGCGDFGDRVGIEESVGADGRASMLRLLLGGSPSIGVWLELAKRGVPEGNGRSESSRSNSPCHSSSSDAPKSGSAYVPIRGLVGAKDSTDGRGEVGTLVEEILGSVTSDPSRGT